MNFLEKFLVGIWHVWKQQKKNYREEGEIDVDIIHYPSIVKRSEALQKTTTFNFSKYPTVVNRPSIGKATISHNCLICGEALIITIRSKKEIMKIIKSLIIVFCLSIGLIFIVSKTPLGSQPYAIYILTFGFTLILSSIAGLIYVLPMEYKKKGISDKIVDISFWEEFKSNSQYYMHAINQLPIEDD